MSSTISERLDTFSPTLKNKAIRLKVRECDEVSKGSFVAYVDEGDDSYDVNLKLSKNKELLELQCDCVKGTKTCIHLVALMLHLHNESPKSEFKGVGKKKISPAVGILADIDEDALKRWLVNLFEKNKDIELAFLAQFNKIEKKYSIEDAFSLTLQGRKAVLKNRRKAEVSEARKIVALWNNLHLPILEAYWVNLTDEPTFQTFMAVIGSVIEQHQTIETGSKVIQQYPKEVFSKTIPHFQDTVEERWTIGISMFFLYIQNNNYILTELIFNFLLDLSQISDHKRKIFLLERLTDRYRLIKKAGYYFPVSCHLRLLNAIAPLEELTPLIGIFEPLHYQNDFNWRLIDVLIEKKNFGNAEKICLDQIKKNVKVEFDYGYFIRLRKIYRLTKELNKLEELFIKLFPFNFNYEDFDILYQHKEENEKIEWGAGLYQMAQTAAKKGNPHAETFCFTYLYHHQLINKMIELIKVTRDLQVILYYFDEMYQEDSSSLLHHLVYRSDAHSIWYHIYNQEVEDYCAFLVEKIYLSYTINEIIDAIEVVSNELKNAGRGRFTLLLLDRLNAEI